MGRNKNFAKLALEFLFASRLCFTQTHYVVSFVLVCQDALNAQLKTTLMTEGLNGLHIFNMPVAVLSNYPELVHEGLVGVEVEQAGLLLQRLITLFVGGLQ